MAIRMELSRILIREITDAQFIELCEVGGERTFPIVVGKPEAFAIDRRLKGIEPPRPQTHELLTDVIKNLGGSLQKILIDDLTDGTFYAKLFIKQGDVEHVVDSRPSDAIAIGVAMQVPIYVDESVLDEVEKDIDSFESPEDFGWE
ncbi:MAG: bifunctional nuclease family protein [Phycisphaerales bacterium]|nr:bifunctional nuclease family protein [Planctomycetota bacterium]MBL6996862.1 bifunctional nuclease family protein [Phycisphaerales bacterium]